MSYPHLKSRLHERIALCGHYPEQPSLVLVQSLVEAPLPLKVGSFAMIQAPDNVLAEQNHMQKKM